MALKSSGKKSEKLLGSISLSVGTLVLEAVSVISDNLLRAMV